MKTLELIIDMMNKFDDKVTPVPQELQQETIAEVHEPSACDQQEVEMAPELEQPSEQGTVEEEAQEEPVPSHTRQQSGKSILRPSKYLMATKLDKRTERDPKKLEAMKKADSKKWCRFFQT
jgi:hypothetical protein